MPDKKLPDKAETPLPLHLEGIHNVFRFSHEEANLVKKRFQDSVELFRVFDKVAEFLDESHWPNEKKNILIEMLAEEREVISFSIRSRSSVVQL